VSSLATTGLLAALSWTATLGTILSASGVAVLLATAPAERDMGWSGLPLAIGAVIGLYVMAGTSVVGLVLASIGLGTAETTQHRQPLRVAVAINAIALVAFLLVFVAARG
jgi:hypothetical protein